MLPDSDYKKLTDPESVALVGVTSRQGKGSNNPLEVLLEWGYQGKIYPVNPKGGTILGHHTYTSLLDVPEIPDVAVICAPRDAVPELFEQCGQKKVKLVIIVAQGFFDGDERGKLMQEELLKAAEKYQVRVLGPNTLGVVNNFNRFCTSFMRFMNPTAATGILCQSGVFVVGAPQITNGIGLLIDTGNTTDLEFSDLLGHLVRDSRLKVINMHMESLRDGLKFMQAARDAVALKPVIVYKTGASPDGSKVASSHTGALSGEDRIFDAAFKQCGLLRAQDVEEMNDLNKVFCTFNSIKGNRVGVVSISGGANVIAVDACSRYGLEIAEMSSNTMDQLSELFPAWAHCSNPVDMWPSGMFHGYHNSYRRILEAFMEDPQIDSVICITGSFLDKDGDFLDTTELIREIAAKYPHKPVVAWTYGQRFQDYAREFEKENNVVYFYSIDRAARALSALYKYHHFIKKKEHHPVSLPANGGQARVEKILAGKMAGNLDQADAFKILEAYGIPLARWGTAGTLEEAVSLAETISYPVSMKVLSPDIVHKSDVGGVRLNIVNDQQLKDAFTEMFREIKLKQPNAKIDGVIIQEYLNKGTELLLGSKREPQFGPILAFGSGGIFTEILNDISLRVLPLSKEDIKEMIAETKVSKILAGARGTSTVDTEILINYLVILAQLLQANPSISEMDINPLLAHGNKVVALDARITLG
jgi:acetate---CoA ligase (ADP-forming)